MGFFRAAATLISPAKSQFTKRLISKRRAMSGHGILAGLAEEGSPEFAFRSVGLESAEFMVSTEATIVSILEAINQRHLVFSYGSRLEYADSDEDYADLIQSWCKLAYGEFTGKWTVKLPAFAALKDFVRYVVMKEHPSSGLSRSNLTDEFLEYAIAEAEYVFRR